MNKTGRNLLSQFLALTLIIFVFGNIVIVAQTQNNSTEKKTYKFINGNWFDGKTFQKKTFYSVNGVFSKKKPKQIDETVDLKNGFVVPPFGEAHNHNIDSEYGLKTFANAYLKNGIFYVKNPVNIPKLTKPLKDRINKPGSIDISFSNGAVTATDGHPIKLYEVNLARVYKFANLETFENQAYYIIDNEEDLENKWSIIMANEPDFIKTVLASSEEFEKRKDDKEFYGSKGLDPKLIPAIVRKAHENNLRVSTHIDTAEDFYNAVDAGVDEVNHLPGITFDAGKNPEKYLIKENDAKLAGYRGMFAIPTYSLMSIENYKEEDKKKYQKQYDDLRVVQRKNLQILTKYGVKIAMGSDGYNGDSIFETFYIKGLDIFDNLTLLKILAENTPQTIFPNRRIAYLKDGYEASFLVLKENPIKDLEAVKNIEMRFKQGQFIKIEEK